jgi:FAD/FMN-containing dehydrogenase
MSLKVVTGTGETLDINKGLVKNNTGYDLKQLMIGSEGTLGVVTEVEVRLTAKPKEKSVLLLGLETLDTLLDLFIYAKNKLPLSAFELFSKASLAHVLNSNTHLKKPLDTDVDHYVLIEVEPDSHFDVTTHLETFFEKEWVVDGILSQNTNQFKELWSFRELITESISVFTPYKNDISVRVSKVPEFIKTIHDTVFKEHKDLSVIVFGHIGDGNLHVNTLKPKDMAQEDFVKKCETVSSLLFTELERLGGSVSAEHGIGLLKKPYLKHSRSQSEIEIMKSIKKVFDPKGILNPGKIF